DFVKREILAKLLWPPQHLGAIGTPALQATAILKQKRHALSTDRTCAQWADLLPAKKSIGLASLNQALHSACLGIYFFSRHRFAGIGIKRSRQRRNLRQLAHRLLQGTQRGPVGLLTLQG